LLAPPWRAVALPPGRRRAGKKGQKAFACGFFGSQQMITITVPGDPVPKGRPRVTTLGGFARTYTPKKTRDYEDRIRAAGKDAVGGDALWPTKRPIILDIYAHFEVPRTWPNWKIEGAAVDGWIYHTTRPDIDNVVKAVMDGLNGVLWDDDAQVMSVTARKSFGRHGLLRVYAYPEGTSVQIARRRA